MPWIQDDCPWCKEILVWETENFREEEGSQIELLVNCKKCEGEVVIRYEVAEIEEGTLGPSKKEAGVKHDA